MHILVNAQPPLLFRFPKNFCKEVVPFTRTLMSKTSVENFAGQVRPLFSGSAPAGHGF
jgi:hypothetical protein